MFLFFMFTLMIPLLTLESSLLVTFIMLMNFLWGFLSLGINPSNFFVCDVFSPSLVFLTLIILMSSIFMFFYPMNSPLLFLSSLTLASLFSTLAFITSNMLMFYMFFEMSVLPTMFMIMGWGYQPERFKATIYLMLYTLCGSMPLLIFLIEIMKESCLEMFYVKNEISIFSSHMNFNLIFSMLMMAFLVKTPMFLIHLWLPKAHVEAPVVGSMFLAAILLKLGSCGMMRMDLMNKVFMAPMLVLSISMISLMWVAKICLSLLDMKMVIAYSSVIHMAVGLILLALSSTMGQGLAILAFTLHGTASSSMFMIAYILYIRSNTRVIILNKMMLYLSPMFSLYFFVFCMGILGAPPSANFLLEILSMMTISSEMNSWPILFFMIFLSSIFLLHMFSLIYHRKNLFHSILYFQPFFLENLSMLWSLIMVLGIPFLILY